MSNQEQKPSFPSYPNQQVKTISYAPMDSIPAMVKNTDNSMLFFQHDPKTNQPTLIAGSNVKLAFSYDKYNRLKKVTNPTHSTALIYNLLGEVEKQTQDEIEINYTQEASTHSRTLSFLDQSITTKIKTQERETLLKYHGSKEIRLHYDYKAMICQ